MTCELHYVDYMSQCRAYKIQVTVKYRVPQGYAIVVRLTPRGYIN